MSAAPPAVLAPPRRGPAAPARRVEHPDLGPGERAVLTGVTWDDYVRLSEDSERTGIKYTFDGPAGLLEIEMSQGRPHELLSRFLYTLILAYAREREIELSPSGSVTVRREDVARGAEPDESFYVTHADFRPPPGSNLLNLEAGEPPPDLVVEIDVTSPGVSKLPIYASLGIPEVWVWSDDEITCRRRTRAGRYERRRDSVELPGFPFALAAETLAPRPVRLLETERTFLERLRAAG